MADTDATAPSMKSPDPSDQYWAWLRGGELRIQRCADCGRLQWPVAPICSHCLSEDLGWESVEAQGHLVTWCTYHRAFSARFVDEVPYVVALVELDAGPQLITRLRDMEALTGRASLALKGVATDDGNGKTLLTFVPAATIEEQV